MMIDQRSLLSIPFTYGAIYLSSPATLPLTHFFGRRPGYRSFDALYLKID
jgi:hypothetical protein